MRNIYMALIFSALTLAADAQKTTIRGRIYDSVIKKALPYTTISLVRGEDSSLVSFTRADSMGSFNLSGVSKGIYLISSSYVGYIPVWKPVVIDGNSSTFDIGDVRMQDLKTAGSLTVAAKRPPVQINNDTLEFNTENFKTQPNAVVEDMLKKMPGVTIETDGTIKINGQTVRRVLVNGKEFFTGDVKMATKNLSADAVDKVQVFDKKSDQAAFTGIDDGNSEKTINLKLKKDKANALFGKLAAGAGDAPGSSEMKYDAQANINKFKGEEQMSLLGMSNNTNRQGFSIQDVLNFTGELSRGMRNGGGITIRTDGNDNNGLPVTGMGQNQQGVATTTAGGVNYNNTWNKAATDLSSNYMGSDIHLVTDKETSTQNFVPGNEYTTQQKSSTVNDNIQHRLNLILDQKIDSSTSIKITPSLTWQHTKRSSASDYTSVSGDNIKLNEGYSNTYSDAAAFNFSSNALLRKRFKKKGRTISLNLTTTYNHSESTGSQISDNKLYDSLGNYVDSALNQTNQRDAISRNIGANVTYTEPIGKKSLLELSTFYNTNTGTSNKQTYNFNDNSGKHDELNTALSNDFRSNYTYRGGGINFRSNLKKINLTIGAMLQNANLETENKTVQQTINQQFTDVLPNAILQYNISRMKTVRFEYSTNTTQPSLTQLQPVADVSDPLNIVIGNPALQRQYNHSVQLNLFAANPARRKNLFAFVNFTTSQNAIVRSDTVKGGGARTTTYTNADGTYNIFGNINYGFPIKQLKSRIEIGLSSTYGKGASFTNGERNDITTATIGPNMSYDFSIDNKIDLSLFARVSLNNSKYSLQSQANNHYFKQTYGMNMTNYLPWGISLNNDFNYIINSGRTDGYNTNVPLWNASLAKSFMKNQRGEIKLIMADVLNKSTGISRTVNQGYITDEKYNVLQRYFLVTFTYSLNKSGLNGGGPKPMIRVFNN